MLNLSIQQANVQFVELLLGEDLGRYVSLNEPRKAVYVRFDVSISDFDKDKTFRSPLCILTSQRYEVFYSFERDIKKENFLFNSSHDCAWRNPEFVNDFYFKSCRKLSDKAPVKLNTFVSVERVSLVSLEIEKDPNCDLNYGRLVKSINVL